MKISRELKTGVVAISIIAIFIWGYNFLKGMNLFDGPVNTYFTEYNNVQGLNTASKVTINGVDVGRVVAINFNSAPEKRGSLIVEFSIENDFEFSKKSIAKIYSASLMGGKSLAIVPSYDGENAKPGDYLQGQIESDIFSSVTEKLNPLQAKVENVIVSADSLMTGLTEVLDMRTRNNLKASVAQLTATMANFNSISVSVDGIVKANEVKLSKTISNTQDISKNLAKLTDSLVSADFGATLKNLESSIVSLNAILGTIEKGNGTVGKLIHDEQMYTNLTNASKELEELLRDMKEHPKRFVHFSLFGKKEKEFQPNTELK